jgi:hypothetical protein
MFFIFLILCDFSLLHIYSSKNICSSWYKFVPTIIGSRSVSCSHLFWHFVLFVRDNITFVFVREEIQNYSGYNNNLFWEFVLIFIFSWFSKNKWSNQNFRQMYIWRRGPRRLAPDVVPHGIKTLPPWDTGTGAYSLRQAVHRGARTLPQRGTVAGARHRGARRQGLFFSFWILKHF